MSSHHHSSTKASHAPTTSDAKLVKSAVDGLSKLASLESPTIDNVREFSKLLNLHQQYIFHDSVLPHFEKAFRGFLRVYGSQERSASDDSTNKWISALSAASARMLEVKRRFQQLVAPEVERIFSNLEHERKMALLPARRKIQEFNAPPPLELPHVATSSSPLPPGAGVGAPFAAYQHVYPPLNGNPSLSDAFQCSTAEHAFIALCGTLKSSGKLHAIARELFCRAYGLHGRFREDHTALTEAARMITHSSTTHINALLYGNMFEKLLADLRAAVPAEVRTREAFGITQLDPPEAVERLRAVARPLFERGYGLNGRIEERRIQLSNEAMALTGCSWNTIQKLWYEGLFEELDDLRHILRPSQRARQSGRMQHFIYNSATPLLGAAPPGSLASMLSPLPPLSQNSIAMQHNDYSGSLPPLRRSPFLSPRMQSPVPSMPSPSLPPSALPSSVPSSPSLRSIPQYQGLHLDRLLSSRMNAATKSLEYLAQMLHPSGGLHSRVWLNKQQLITRPEVIEAFEEEMGDKVKQEDKDALDDLAAAGAAHAKKKKGDATTAAKASSTATALPRIAATSTPATTAEKSPARKRKRISEEEEDDEPPQTTAAAVAPKTKSRVKPEPGLPRTPEVIPAAAPSTPNTRSSKAANVKQEHHATPSRALIQAPVALPSRSANALGEGSVPSSSSSSDEEEEEESSSSEDDEDEEMLAANDRRPPSNTTPTTAHRIPAASVSPAPSASTSTAATVGPSPSATSVSNLTDLLRTMKTKPQFIVIDAENLGRWGGSGEADGITGMSDTDGAAADTSNSVALSSSNVRFESWQLSACIKSVERCIADANLRAQVVCCLPERYILSPSAHAVKDAWVLNVLQRTSKLHRLPSGIDTQMEMVKLVLHGDTFLITNDPLLQPQQARLVSAGWVQNRTLQYYTFGLAFQRGCEACRAMRDQGPSQIANDLKKEAEKCALSCMGSVFLASKTVYTSPTELQPEPAPSSKPQQPATTSIPPEDRIRKKKKQKN